MMQTWMVGLALLVGCNREVWLGSASSELSFDWPEGQTEVWVNAVLFSGPGDFPQNPIGNALRARVRPSMDIRFPDHEDRLEEFAPGIGARNLLGVMGQCSNPSGCERVIAIRLTDDTPPDSVIVSGDIFVSSRPRDRVDLPDLDLMFEVDETR